MAPKKSSFIEEVKVELASTFHMSDISPISFYLGLRVDQNQEEKIIKLSKPAYIEKVLCKFFLNQANSTNTPIIKFVHLLSNNDKTVIKAEQEKY